MLIKKTKPKLFFIVRRYASAVFAMAVCLSVCHKSVCYQNG